MKKATIKRRAIRRRFTVPVYADAVVHVVVADDLKRVRDSLKVFDPWEDANRHHAFMSWNERGDFGIFLKPGWTDDDLCHELLHLTHRIMEWCNVKFSPDNHEPFACLQGWLAKKVYEIVRSNGR